MRTLSICAILLIASSCGYGDRIAVLEASNVGVQTRLTAFDTLARRHSDQLAGVEGRLEIHGAEIRSVAALLDDTRREIRGIGLRTVAIPASEDYHAAFGNHSGHNATVYLTNSGYIDPSKLGSLHVLVRRVKKPSEENAGTIPAPPPGLPPDYELTEMLDLAAPGASRTMRIPCGYELLAGGTAVAAKLDVLIYYDEPECHL